MTRWGAPVISALFLLLGGCAGDGSTFGEGGIPLEPTLESIQANIFDLRCTSCHTVGGSAPFSLDSGLSYDTMVGVPSTNLCFGVDRVEPGEPDDSCLVRVIEGFVLPQMPLGGDPLSEEEIQAIRDWIQGGAEP